MVTAVDNDSLFLNWTYNTNVTFVESWNVTYTSLIDGTTDTVNILANSSQPNVSHNITGLTSGHTYTISIYSIVQKSVSKSVSLNATVREYFLIMKSAMHEKNLMISVIKGIEKKSKKRRLLVLDQKH